MVSFATWLASDAKRLHLDARIEGVGTWLSTSELTAANDDARYRFSISQPPYASGQPASLWLPYLKEPLPDLRAEDVDGVFGGVPDYSGMNLRLVDVNDALTLLFATEVAPVTALAEDLSTTETGVDVEDASAAGITNESVIWIGAEAMRVTGVAGDTCTVERGYLGTEATIHSDEDAVFVTNPYLIGRRIELRIAPLNANDEDDEETVFDGIVDGIEWDEVYRVWVLSATSVLRYLDRVVPFNGHEFTIASFDPAVGSSGNPYLTLYEDESQVAISDWAHWTGDFDFYAEIDGKEIVAAYLSATSPGVFLLARGLFGTEELEIKEGMAFRQVFVSGDPIGSWPSSFRSLDPGDQLLTEPSVESSHWVDLMLVVLTSPSEDSGLWLPPVAQAPNHDGVHRNYSVLPPGYGLGYPASLIDFDSFLEVKARTTQYVFPNFVLGSGGKPEKGTKLLTETFLEPMGAYLSMDSGRLQLLLPRIPLRNEVLPTFGPSDWHLEKAERHTYRPSVKARVRTTEHVSSITYEVGPDKREVAFLASDFTATVGLRGQYAGRTNDVRVKVDAGEEGMGDLYGARAQSRFLRQRRPRVELAGDARIETAWSTPSGTLVSVSLQGLPNLSTGLRGWSSVVCDVRKREFRLDVARTKVGGDTGGKGLYAMLELLAHPPNFLAARIAPAALVVGVTGAYDVEVSPNRYTSSDATTLPSHDAEAFTVGDVVRLINPDGTSASAGTQVVEDIDSGTDTLTLDGNFGGDLAADLILVAAAYDDASTRQQGWYAYQADRATQRAATGAPAMTFGED